MASCAICGATIGPLRRVFANRICERCGVERKAKRRQARFEYQELLGRLSSGTKDAGQAAVRLKELAPMTEFGQSELALLNRQAFRGFAETELGEDILSKQEEKAFNDVTDALGISQAGLQTEHRDLLNRIVVARVNDGRIPDVPEPHMLTNHGEVVHAEARASLMKEVAARARQDGYGGFSFRIVKGVRFDTGGVRGHRVVVGKRLEVADAGIVCVSSQRVVFIGSRFTIEIPYSRLVSLNVFEDGIQFHASDRRSAPLFQLEAGHVIGAIAAAAAQNELK